MVANVPNVRTDEQGFAKLRTPAITAKRSNCSNGTRECVRERARTRFARRRWRERNSAAASRSLDHKRGTVGKRELPSALRGGKHGFDSVIVPHASVRSDCDGFVASCRRDAAVDAIAQPKHRPPGSEFCQRGSVASQFVIFFCGTDVYEDRHD